VDHPKSLFPAAKQGKSARFDLHQICTASAPKRPPSAPDLHRICTSRSTYVAIE
jgi:hypothetical protein